MDENQWLIKNKSFKSIEDLFHLNKTCPFIAGPCAIESLTQMETIAKALVEKNIKLMRGGAYKPRTSPYDFQGLGLEGLKIFDYVRKKYQLIAVSEILDPRDVEIGTKYLDIIQIGSRNMQNFPLLKEAGRCKCPVLLKRGMSATIKEWLLAAEYILLEGNENVILCERGIRTFETSTRNTLDISSVAIIKQQTTVPIVVDISHSTGRKDILATLMKAVLALDVIVMVEVDVTPLSALSDAQQQLSIKEFYELLQALEL